MFHFKASCADLKIKRSIALPPPPHTPHLENRQSGNVSSNNCLTFLLNTLFYIIRINVYCTYTPAFLFTWISKTDTFLFPCSYSAAVMQSFSWLHCVQFWFQGSLVCCFESDLFVLNITRRPKPRIFLFNLPLNIQITPHRWINNSSWLYNFRNVSSYFVYTGYKSLHTPVRSPPFCEIKMKPR